MGFGWGFVAEMMSPANIRFEFDAEQALDLKGVVTKLELGNPHSGLYLDAKQTDGSAKNWGFEFGAPFSLKQKGITKASLPVGSDSLSKVIVPRTAMTSAMQLLPCCPTVVALKPAALRMRRTRKRKVKAKLNKLNRN